MALDRTLLLWWLPRFNTPDDAGSPERLHRSGRYGKAARKLSKAELREQAEAAFRAWGAGQTKDK